MDIKKIYADKHSKEDINFRSECWKILCYKFFSKYIKSGDAVLELGSDDCTFINNISCKKKIAVDVNDNVKDYADPDVRVVISDCTDFAKDIAAASLDIVFISNLLEHVDKESIIRTFSQSKRVLKGGGRLIIHGPNIKYCKSYWDWFDHITPLSDVSVCQILEAEGFQVVTLIPRFLPNKVPKKAVPSKPWVLSLYLSLSWIWPLLGETFFIIAKKP